MDAFTVKLHGWVQGEAREKREREIRENVQHEVPLFFLKNPPRECAKQGSPKQSARGTYGTYGTYHKLLISSLSYLFLTY